MATVTLKGNPIQIHGALPAVGSDAPGFRLVGGNLKDITLHDFAGKRKILNIFPSVDTPTCATSVRRRMSSTDVASRPSRSRSTSLARAAM